MANLKPESRARPRVRESTWLAVSGAVIAGMLHLVLVGVHGGLQNAHGIVFLVLGLEQLGWAGLWLVQRPRWAWRLGVLLAGASIVLWLVSRVLRAPFSWGTEDVDAPGIVTKLAEATTLAGLLLHEGEEGRGVRPAVPWVAAGLALGLAAYGGALAAEPLFPGLGEARPGAQVQGEALVLAQEHEHEEVQLTLDPAPRAGEPVNATVQLSVHGADDTKVRGVNVTLAHNGTSRTADLQPWTAAGWRAAIAFGEPGDWKVLVRVDRTWAPATTLTFDIPVSR